MLHLAGIGPLAVLDTKMPGTGFFSAEGIRIKDLGSGFDVISVVVRSHCPVGTTDSGKYLLLLAWSDA